MLDLGGVTLRAVDDDPAFALPRAMLFPDSEPEPFRDSLAVDPEGYDPAADAVILAVRVFVVQAAGRTVLVDLGIGDGKPRPARPAWHCRNTDFLARLSVAPEAVDAVILTHLHADHVGWATRPGPGGWEPSFPNARHVVSAPELAHWSARAAGTPPPNHDSFADSVAPLLAAGLLDAVAPDATVLPGLRLEPLPGHSPGQVGIWLEGTLGRALIAADALHHAAQIACPEMVSAFCADPAQTVATRRRVLALAAATGCTLIPAHGRGMDGWRVRQSGDRYVAIG
jgi:glyoxylase-like metal-dependent hydrolase (beta-lactamase superfamily II)